MENKDQIDARKELSQKRIEWMKEKELLLQKIEQLEETITDYKDRETRYKATQKKLLHALELVDNTNDSKVTQNMIKNLADEVRMIRTSKDATTVFDGLTVDGKRSRDGNIVVQREFDYDELQAVKADRINKSENKRRNNGLDKAQCKDRRSLATLNMGHQKDSDEMSRLEEFFSKRNKQLFQESIDNDYEDDTSYSSQNTKFGFSHQREKTRSFPAHLLGKMQKGINYRDTSEGFLTHKTPKGYRKGDSMIPFFAKEEYMNFKDLSLLNRHRKASGNTQLISNKEYDDESNINDNLFFRDGSDYPAKNDTEKAILKYKKKLEEKLNRSHSNGKGSMFNSQNDYEVPMFKTQEYKLGNKKSKERFRKFETQRENTTDGMYKAVKNIRKSAYLETQKNFDQKNREMGLEDKSIYESLNDFYSKKGIHPSLSNMKKYKQAEQKTEKTERNKRYINLRRDYLKTGERLQSEFIDNVLSNKEMKMRLSKKVSNVTSECTSQLDISSIRGNDKRKAFQMPHMDKSQNSSTIFYKTSDPVRIKSIKINMANQDIQMELTNGMKQRGFKKKNIFGKEEKEPKPKSVEVSKFKAKSSNGFRSFVRQEEESVIFSRAASSTAKGKMFSNKFNKYMRKSAQPNLGNRARSSTNSVLRGKKGNDDCNISKKEVIEILKLHKNLQHKIKYLENKFSNH